MMSVAASLYAKKRLAMLRSWLLPVCIDCQHIQTELDVLTDGCWGAFAGGACLLYLIQQYKFMGTERTSIFLYGGTMGLNPMIKPHHQLDSELMAISLGQKKAQKTLETLMAFNIFPTLRLISDSQTSLTLCFKPAVTLAMGTGLLVHRVQDLFTNAGLYFAPGHLFNGNVNLLTRYDQLLASKITKECYSPAFLRLRL